MTAAVVNGVSLFDDPKHVRCAADQHSARDHVEAARIMSLWIGRTPPPLGVPRHSWDL